MSKRLTKAKVLEMARNLQDPFSDKPDIKQQVADKIKGLVKRKPVEK